MRKRSTEVIVNAYVDKQLGGERPLYDVTH